MDMIVLESNVGLVNSLVFPEIENARRLIKTKNGMTQAAMHGYFLGIAPVGYENSRTVHGKSTLLINPDVGPWGQNIQI
jgi:site-specific DNA recombinase